MPSSPEPDASEAMLRLLLNWAPASLAVFDREMKYVLHTQEWVDHLPVGDGPLAGRMHSEVLPGLLPRWVEGHERALMGETVSAEADSYNHPDGTKRWVSWTIRPWSHGVHGVVGSLVTFQEITRQLKTESKLRREMEAAAATKQAKARLLVSTSYEVRAAMNSIVGMAHICLRSVESDKMQNHLGTIIEEANALTSSFEDILDLSKIETGSLHLENRPFNMGEVLNELAGEMGTKAEDKGVEFVYQLPPDCPLDMLGDANRLRQVLTKLCRNAVNLTERGEIELSIRLVEQKATQATLEFLVRDTSPALTPEERETLMKPYSPGDCDGNNELAQARLNLSICRSLIDLMRGRLRIESEANIGNAFIFTATFGISAQNQVMGDTPPNALMGARVLVVDDHRLSRKTMSRLLRTFDFEVAVAESGPKAIEMAEEACTAGAPYQFVFMDYLMPGMDGLETTAKLKQRLRQHGPPKIILMTGYPMKEKLEEMNESPLDGYICKPFTPSLVFYAMLDAATAWPAADSEDGRVGVVDSQPTALRGSRVLLVEDDPINQEIIREILGEAGVKVDVANHGQEGLNQLGKEKYEAVLMDIQMPVMDGYEATCRIRNEEQYSDLPIIALTASSMTLDRHASLEVGMNAHVAKPINPDELFSVLMEWIDPVERSEGSEAGAEVDANAESKPVAVEPSVARAALHFESLDVEKGLALLGGREELYTRVLQKFAAKQVATDREVRAALAIGDHDAARRLVHTLKGLAGSIGAQELEVRAEEMESVLERKDSDAYETHLRLMSAELQRVLRELSDCEALWAGTEQSGGNGAALLDR